MDKADDLAGFCFGDIGELLPGPSLARISRHVLLALGDRERVQMLLRHDAGVGGPPAFHMDPRDPRRVFESWLLEWSFLSLHGGLYLMANDRPKRGGQETSAHSTIA